MSNPSPLSLATAVLHLRASLYFQLASFSMLLFDHVITFDEEVERIWKKPISGASILFLINRYVTPFQLMVGVVSFFSPSWSNNKTACNHFFRYDGGSTMSIVAICEIVVMLRVYALWNRNIYILCLLVTLWTLQVVLSGVANVHTQRVVLPPGFPGCIETGAGPLFEPFWVTPLISDSAVFLLTLWKTRAHSGHIRAMPMIRRFRQDGIIYFFCIFGANLLNTTLYLHAPEDLKAIGATFSQAITSVMVSRLVLNLRGVGTSSKAYETSSLTIRIIGNLGEHVDYKKAEDSTDTNSIELGVFRSVDITTKVDSV